MLRNLTRPLFIAIATLALSACTSLGPKPAEQIIGEWQTSVGTFPLAVTFSADVVQLGSSDPVTYVLIEDRLSYENAGKQIRIVSFPDAVTMQQLDPVTGTAHQFSRVTP